MQKNETGAKSTGETISEKQDIRQSKKAAKQDEVTLTPEETASETAETTDRQAEADRGAKVHRIWPPGSPATL